MAECTLILETYEVDLKDKLGKGGFGTVYKGRHIHQGNIVAVKKCDIDSDQQGFQAMKEVKNFQQLDKHRNVVHLLDFFYRDSSFWFVMEYCESGDLVRYMRKSSPHLDEKIDIMYQCASAIAYMHSRKNPVVHRDIKPANILLKMEDRKPVVKVTDFGLSKILQFDPMANYNLTTQAGTPAFMAPEVSLQRKYTPSVDVFSLGLVYSSMLSFKPGDHYMMPIIPSLAEIGAFMTVGQHFAHCIRNNKSAPSLVVEEPNDSAKDISVKGIISKMTAALPNDRSTMPEVKRDLGQIAGIASETINTIGNIMDTKLASQGQSQYYQHTNEGQPETSSKPLGEQNVAKAKDEGINIIKEALDKVIQDQMTSSTSEQKPDVVENKHPYSSFLHGVLENTARPNHTHDDPRKKPKLKVGDRVFVDPDEERLKLLQIGHGEYTSPMKMYLGREGVVRERYRNICKVQFDDSQVWTYNPEALVLTAEGDDFPLVGSSMPQDFQSKRYIDSMFNRYDIVQMPKDEELVRCLQKGHGGWDPKMKNCLGMKGIVNNIGRSGQVYVEFLNGGDWHVNPEILQHVDVSDSRAETGDFVIVSNKIEMVKKAQEDIGQWSSKIDEKSSSTQ